MGRVPVAGVVRRAEQEIAVVLERVDVVRAAALDLRQLGMKGIIDHVELREHDQEQRPEADRKQQKDRDRRAVSLEEPGLAAGTEPAPLRPRGEDKEQGHSSGARKIAAIVKGLVIGS